MPGPTSETRKERFKLIRTAKFAAVEEAKPLDQRLINRQDFDDHVFRQLCYSREQSIIQMKDWFVGFLNHDHVQICETEEDARKYFEPQPHGKTITTRLFRQFIQYLVDSRSGNIPENNGRLAYKTLEQYIELLKTAAVRSHNPIDKDVWENAKVWVVSRLLPEGLVGKVHKKKELTMTADVTEILKVLFSKNFMATQKDTRTILSLALFINMAIDCCGRIGEIVQVYHYKAPKNKHLCWKHVRVFVFLEDGRVVLRALVAYENLKSFDGCTRSLLERNLDHISLVTSAQHLQVAYIK